MAESTKRTPLSNNRPDNETEVRALVEAWADAVRNADLERVLAHHIDDLVMFDVPRPLQLKGIEPYKNWLITHEHHSVPAE
jgi:ketosteroid isomerase-like protein